MMQSRKMLNLLSIATAPLLLAACGGGSGGPAGPGGSTSFVGFPEIQPNTTKTINGSDVNGDPVKADVAYDGDGDLKSVKLTADGVSRTWNTKNSEENPDAPPGLMIADRKDGSASVGFAKPEENGFEYQTYGAWVTYDGDGSVEDGGGFSVGTPTEAAAVDTAGTATFKGTAAGIYVTDSGDTTDVMTAKAQLDVDFANRSIAFQTSDSQLGETGPAAGLDMNGTLTYTSGSNGFQGDVNTAGMIGTANGRFYGPAATEAGGSFSLDGVDEHLRGGFGAVRQP